MSHEIKNAQQEITQALEELKQRKEKSVKGFRDEMGEVHKTFDVLDGYAGEVRDANASFRAFLGQTSNSPPQQPAPEEPKKIENK